MKLNTELQVAVNDELVARVGQFFNYDVSDWNELSGGIENTVVAVTLPDGSEKVQKHYNKGRELARISLELLLMEGAAAQSVPLPHLDSAANSTDLVFKHQAQNHEWYVVSMDKIDGHHPDKYRGGWVNELARHQARLHGSRTDSEEDWDTIDLINDYEYFSIDPTIHNNLADLSEAILPHWRKVEDIWHALPSGLSHHDITRSNVLVADDALAAVIDFEDVAEAPYIFCLSGTLWDVLISTGLDEVKKYLASYEKVRALSILESDALKDMVILRGWIDLHGKLLTAGYGSDLHMHSQRHLEHLVASQGFDFTSVSE